MLSHKIKTPSPESFRIPVYISIKLVDMKSCFLLLLSVLVVAPGGSVGGQAAGLKHHFYKKSCPEAEQIVQNIIWKHVAQNPTLPAKFLRLFFHDCFVRGCDASVLIKSTANNTAEKDAGPNLSLAGFDVIDEVKEALEKACPETVSCADIVALAARDSVSFQFKEPLWEVQTGRRDGTISKQSEALANIPSPAFNFATLVQRFAAKTLDVKDLVVLSGIEMGSKKPAKKAAKRVVTSYQIAAPKRLQLEHDDHSISSVFDSRTMKSHHHALKIPAHFHPCQPNNINSCYKPVKGAHTIGVGHCNVFSNRLYNFTGKGDADPSLNATYAAFLKTQCKSLSDNTTAVPMDPGSVFSFDSHYYENLKLHQGLFQSDAALLTNRRSINIVDKMLKTKNFFNAFKHSIKRMGAVEVLTGTNGEIRKKCSAANS